MTVSEEDPGRFFRRGLAAIVVVAVLVRLALLVPGFGRLIDPDNYLVLARSLAEGRGFVLEGRPTAYRPPLVSDGPGPAGRGLRRPACLGRSPACTWRWGGDGRADRAGRHGGGDCRPRGLWSPRRSSPSTRSWWLRAAMVMTETLAAFLVAVILAALGGTIGAVRCSAGLAFGLAALCRPSMLPAAGLISRRPRSSRGRAAGATGCDAAAVLVASRRSRRSPPGRCGMPGSSASRSGRPPTAATRWRWRTTRSITPRCSTVRRARSGRGRTSDAGSTAAQREWRDCPSPEPTAGSARPACGS